jgi:hypothetical protein
MTKYGSTRRPGRSDTLEAWHATCGESTLGRQQQQKAEQQQQQEQEGRRGKSYRWVHDDAQCFLCSTVFARPGWGIKWCGVYNDTSLPWRSLCKALLQGMHATGL